MRSRQGSSGGSSSSGAEPGGATLVSPRDLDVEKRIAEHMRKAPDVVVEPQRSGSSPPLGSVQPGSAAPPLPRRDSGGSLISQELRASVLAAAPRRSRSPRKSSGELLWTVAKFGALGMSAVLVGSALAVVLTIRHYESGLPSVDQLRSGYAPPQVTRVLARDGTVLADIFTERRTVVPIAEIPPHVKLAFLAAEDAHFYEHQGLNYVGMLRALGANLRSGRTMQGGSTITQQVVKNVLLDSERSYNRKIRETILARRVEQNLTKDEIFGLYLNHIYFGHGRYGVEEASRFYFGKHAKDLDLAEGALLAGIVAGPERFSPRHSPEKALERRAYVLQQMVEKAFVTPELHRQVANAPLRLAPDVAVESELSPEVVGYAKELLAKVVGDRARLGGFTVTTSLDAEAQSAARRAVRDNLNAYAKRQKLAPPYVATERKLWGPPFKGTPKANHIYVGTVVETNDALGSIEMQVGDARGRILLGIEERYNPQRLLPSKFTQPGAVLRVGVLNKTDATASSWPLRLELGPQSALVAIDVRSREVRALVGSYEALLGGLDRTRSKRQPGSSFKPFVYSYALHSRRFAPSTVLRITDPKAEGGSRTTSLRTAVAKSDNAVAEKVLQEVGAENVVEWAHAAGIESKLGATASLALGAYEVTPLELTNAYVTFASGGEFAPYRLVTKITGPDGAAIPLPVELPVRRVLQPEEAFLTTSLLRGVITQGTAARASSLGRPLAGKTGTTNQVKDTWFVGYSPELVAGVWVGYDDAIPMGSSEQGATTALPAWMDFMKAAHARRPVSDFPRPANIVLAKVDPATGLLPYLNQEDAIEEEFLPGTVPGDAAPRDAGIEPAAAPEADAGTGSKPVSENYEAPATGAAPAASEARQDPAPGNDETEPPPF